MALSPCSCHVLKLSAITFFVIFTLYYLFLKDEYNFHEIHDTHDAYQVAVTGKKGTFVEDLLANEIDGPFDNSALAALCSSKTWTPGLIFRCEAPQGGIGNVRNVFMNCVRYAIEAGATGFIVPEIMVRGPTLTDLHTNQLVPFTYFFDHSHFATSLHTACPQMHIYNHQNDLWDMPSTASPVRLIHPSLTTDFHSDASGSTIGLMRDPSQWRAAFFSELNTVHPAKFSVTRPVLVSLYTPFLQWPIDYDEPAFIATFGRVFRFREDVRRLATTVLYAMNKKYALGFDPEAPGLQEGKFYGAHLRTAMDATSAGWTSYDIQADHYLSHAAHNYLSLIYVASGSPPDIERLKEQAKNYTFPMEVATKSLLFAEKEFTKERDEMNKLTWDQQGLIDYEVLLRASRLGGTWESSFGWNLAMRRHVTMGRGTWIPLEPPTVNRSNPPTPTGILVGARPRTVDPSEEEQRKQRAERHAEIELQRKELPTNQQAFNDAYSIVFGDVTPGNHPGRNFELGLWP